MATKLYILIGMQTYLYLDKTRSIICGSRILFKKVLFSIDAAFWWSCTVLDYQTLRNIDIKPSAKVRLLGLYLSVF